MRAVMRQAAKPGKQIASNATRQPANQTGHLFDRKAMVFTGRSQIRHDEARESNEVGEGGCAEKEVRYLMM